MSSNGHACASCSSHEDEFSGVLANLQVNGLIRGRSEALELRPVGSKWQIVTTPRESGANATLIFDVEFLAIK